jgi:hypothetical protein
VKTSDGSPRATPQPHTDAVRDPLASFEAVLAARRRPMSERLELALSWNAVAYELRAGLATVAGRPKPVRLLEALDEAP